MAGHSIVLLRRPLPLSHAVLVLLGLLAVMAGVLGMHTFSVSHHAVPEHAVSSPDAGTFHSVQGAPDTAAALTSAGPEIHSATCAGACGTEHRMAETCAFLVVLTGFILAALLQRLRGSGSRGLRAPPHSPIRIPAVPRPPSLLLLSVSRT